jgi:hypothetical protein
MATEETILMPGERFREEFECEEHSVWLNTAHQGRLPKRAARALAEAVEWKLHPAHARLRGEQFEDIQDSRPEQIVSVEALAVEQYPELE